MAFLGVDIGSVSVKTAWISENSESIQQTYRRHYGQPAEVAREVLIAEIGKHPDLTNIGFTGSGGKRFAALLDAPFENEIVCQSRAAARLTPEARGLIVVGGEDSYYMVLDGDGGIKDFAMNGVCAAGCGSFLDQQASRLGVNIEGEFGELAVQSDRPARVAGRCSVFAKTDMIHLQQKATPVQDIIAGLCFAFARNFVAVLARGKEFVPPIAFHGGVALNAGMVRAFTEVLDLAPEQLIVTEHAATAGAFGAALLALRAGARQSAIDLTSALSPQGGGSNAAQPPLPDPGPPPPSRVYSLSAPSTSSGCSSTDAGCLSTSSGCTSTGSGCLVDAYLGVDVGSISTNVVLMDAEKRVLAKRYLMTAGRPIEAVRQGLAEVADEFADRVSIRGVCTTGSGRYLTGDFIGADVVKNEITAQARAAAEIDPEVDTIFEIGGQDSKYISLENGAIVDFEMNKVCAAGTGSFLEEQAERLGISIKGEFADLALSADAPVRLGERCTVFMESDLVGQQARGATTPCLAAGLAYSTVYNYLNRVVGERKVGDRIFFQGGTAFNRSVVAAFQQVTGKQITVPEHHEVTGAIGCCLIAMENSVEGVPSRFKGWDVSKREYRQDSFECKSCSNRCEINRVRVQTPSPPGAGEGWGEGGLIEETLIYGGRCEKFEKKKADISHIPDLFAERETAILAGYREGVKQPGRPLIGIPRALHVTEYAPFWFAFFDKLGVPIKLSSPTNKQIIDDGLEAVLAEFCFPVKVAHGHAMELIEAGVTHLFAPCILQLPKLHDGYDESVQCPYVSSLAYTLRAALDPESKGVSILDPAVDMADTSSRAVKRLHEQLKDLGVTRRQVEQAMLAGHEAQRAFGEEMAARGREVLDGLGANETAVVIMSRAYNGCDSGINLALPTTFRELGVLPIPLDMMPLEDVDLSDRMKNLAWRSGHKILTGAEIVRRDPRLHAVYITNFGCGPDSFLLKFFRAEMGGKTFLQIEIDEHSSDVGALTRCEAFLDSLGKSSGESKTTAMRPNTVPTDNDRVMYLPYMHDVAHAVAAAFKSVGIPSELLPPSDSETIAIGKQFCTGKECLPCIMTTGDIVKLMRKPGLDASKVAFFIPSVSGSGGCRFGCYNLLHRLVLDDLGYESVPVFAPNQNKGFYETLGAKAGNDFVRRAWQGIIAIELLEKALHHVRPLVPSPQPSPAGGEGAGTAEGVYQKALAEVIRAVESKGDLLPVMKEARAAFEALPMGSNGQPWIGIVGEVFVRANEFSNQDLVRRVEELGGRAWLAPLSEWLFYVNHGQKTDTRRDHKWTEYLNVSMVDKVMRSDEHRLAKVWEGLVPHAIELPPEDLIELGKEYVDPKFFGEPIVSLGKAQHLHDRGLAGVINVMPFTCMLGTITCGLLKRFQRENDGMPVLNLAFDGQEVGDLPIRLEAFIEQCRSRSRK